jgi:hypothetical protein
MQVANAREAGVEKTDSPAGLGRGAPAHRLLKTIPPTFCGRSVRPVC